MSDSPPLASVNPDPDAEPGDAEGSEMEKAARRHFGLRLWERPALYREMAVAATDTDVPFFAVLLLSGAIATLGLVLNSTAVVIGAMLVAPLLGPLLGLSVALAVGDGRLFVQTAAAVVAGAAGIVGLAALLTWALPFETVTDEIASRTRPTTLDLGIAVFSGLAGAVVTASRETRLSASIPGVAVAVALVPPLGVAGFGLAQGNGAIASGALLLFGANLAGIVLSGMGVFFLIGMHRPDVVEAAQEWHGEGHATGLAARLEGADWVTRLPGFTSAKGRAALVVAFMAAVAVPLTTSLRQVVRESRVAAAVAGVEAEVEGDGGAFVIDRDITYGEDAATVRLRVATADWITEGRENALEAALAEAAGEPVTLDVEQVLASSGDLAAFAAVLPERPAVRTAPAAPEPAPLPTTLATVRGRLSTVLSALALPDSVAVVGGRIEVDADDRPTVEVAVAAPRRLGRDVEAMVARQAAAALGLDAGAASVVAVRLGASALPDSAASVRLGALLARYPRLRLTLAGDTAAVRAARQRLGGAAVRVRPDTLAPRARLALLPDSTRQ